jgi:uncharacterized protein (TIGR03435 family)
MSQTPVAPAFEVASIRPASFPSEAYFLGFSTAGSCGKPPIAISGSRVSVPRITLCGLIRISYNVPDHLISGLPAAMTKQDQSNWFAVQAVAAESALTQDQARVMLQTLLAERFQLRFHRESRDLPIYALVLAKNGSKGKLSTEPLTDGLCGEGAARAAALKVPGPGEVSCKPTATMAQLADRLTAQTDRPVVDKTGLTGRYAYSFRYSLEGAPLEPNSPPSFFTAIQEQLGLKLEPQKSQVEMLVVDHAEPPTAN